MLWSSLLGPWSGLLAAAALEEKRFQVITNLHLFRICASVVVSSDDYSNHLHHWSACHSVTKLKVSKYGKFH